MAPRAKREINKVGGGEPRPLHPIFADRRQEQFNFVNKLRSDQIRESLSEDQFFSDIVKLSINAYGVKQGELANTLGISTAAVSRWATGKTAPAGGYARSQVIEIIALLVEKQLSEDLSQDAEKKPERTSGRELRPPRKLEP